MSGSPPKGSGKEFEKLEGILGYSFVNRSLIEQALTHSSWEGGAGQRHNETLEFLGDAVLDLIIAELLMKRHADWSEGRLSRVRASLVNGRVLADLAREMDLQLWVILGRGEEKDGGREKPGILANVYESVLGALFLDGGYDKVRDVVAAHFDRRLGEAVSAGTDFKTELQELTQRQPGRLPVYQVSGVEGPDHARNYRVVVRIDGKEMGSGSGRSRKEAEQGAAREALDRLRSR
ncbi:MAG: ribonuclease III [Candidatus Binatia bacterium]